MKDGLAHGGFGLPDGFRARARMHVQALLLRSVPHECHHLLRERRWPLAGRCALGLAVLLLLGAAGFGGLWWRLGSGPMSIDMATPWLASALQERFGAGHRVEVGGTLLERDDDGHTALRMVDIVVRDAGGTVVASAPKAEVSIAGGSLMAGRLRAEKLNLIGAAMALRIEQDGQVGIFASTQGDRPLVSVAGPVPVIAGAAPEQGAAAGREPLTTAADTNTLALVLAWLQGLDANGFDGEELAEIGLKSGSLAIDDRRTGKRVAFEGINFSLTRLANKAVALTVSSTGADGPWSLNVTVTPQPDGGRVLEAAVRDLSPKDILLALRLDTGDLLADAPLSGTLRAEIAADGTPKVLAARIVAGAGYIGSEKDPSARVLLDEVQADLRWDPAGRVLRVPIEVQSGASRVALQAQLEPPAATGAPWAFAITGGSMLLGGAERTAGPALLLDRMAMRAVVDTAKRRVELAQLDIRGVPAGVAVSGVLDYAAEPRMRFSVAGSRMSVAALKRMWPAFIAPPVRAWFEQHVVAGEIEKLVVAADAPLTHFREGGPPLADDALSVEFLAKNGTVEPVPGVPAIKDADIAARITGRTVRVTSGHGAVELPSGRRVVLSGFSFDVADLRLKPPRARVAFRADAGVDAVAELLALEAFRDAAAVTLDPATLRGTIGAQIVATVPMRAGLERSAFAYTVDADVTGLSAERVARGHRLDAGALRVTASQDALLVKGEVKIAGTPAQIEFRKARGQTDADFRAQLVLDDAARSRLGLDLGSSVSGSVPLKVSGRVRDRDMRLGVEADLTQARLVDLLPGWTKPAGRAARASFTVVDRGPSVRLEDFTLDGGGAQVRGALEIDSRGDVLSANFPSFAVSDGDKASVKIDRGSDGALKVVLRGDVLDGRGLLKTAVLGQKAEPKNRRSLDVDLDIRIGAITGHHGEALRALDLRLSRRGGLIRSLTMTGKLGRDSQVLGDLRGRGRGGRQVAYLETNDAGALFRFADIYPRIFGGALSVAMDPPNVDNSAQEGLLNLRDFVVRGEPALDRVAANSVPDSDRGAGNSAPAGGGVAFSRLRSEFTKAAGRFSVRDGVVWGPAVGATVDGDLDYGRNEVRLRGTFVPAYALNNLFSRVPIVGMFLGGGSNEGLLGVTYQVVGTPVAPVLNVNPMSGLAPGFLRKLFEFRGAEDRSGQVPEATR